MSQVGFNVKCNYAVNWMLINMIFIILGPGQYAPEKTKLDKTPQYSFGLRPDISKPSDVPGK